MTISLVRCYYNVGGTTRLAADIDVSDLLSPDEESEEGEEVGEATSLLCAVISPGGVEAELYATIEDLNEAQEDYTKYIIPLYAVSGGDVVADLRNAPQVQAFEGTL